jgi:hypothetical protein
MKLLSKCSTLSTLLAAALVAAAAGSGIAAYAEDDTQDAGFQEIVTSVD